MGNVSVMWPDLWIFLSRVYLCLSRFYPLYYHLSNLFQCSAYKFIGTHIWYNLYED